MTFLELVRRVARACGMTNRGDIPTTVSEQVGNLLDAVQWVQDAWRELQVSRNNWLWMRAGFTLSTQPGVDTYAASDAIDDETGMPIVRHAYWRLGDGMIPEIRCYLQSGSLQGQYWLTPLPWEHFQALYRIGSQNPGQPINISIDPRNRLVIGPTPNDVYVIKGDHQRSAQELIEDSDEPEMPADYHMVIFYDAILKYAGSEAAAEVMARAQIEGPPLKGALRMNQLPTFQPTAPLA